MEDEACRGLISRHASLGSLAPRRARRDALVPGRDAAFLTRRSVPCGSTSSTDSSGSAVLAGAELRNTIPGLTIARLAAVQRLLVHRVWARGRRELSGRRGVWRMRKVERRCAVRAWSSVKEVSGRVGRRGISNVVVRCVERVGVERLVWG